MLYLKGLCLILREKISFYKGRNILKTHQKVREHFKFCYISKIYKLKKNEDVFKGNYHEFTQMHFKMILVNKSDY